MGNIRRIDSTRNTINNRRKIIKNSGISFIHVIFLSGLWPVRYSIAVIIL